MPVSYTHLDVYKRQTYIVQVLMSLMMLAMVFLQSSRAVASARRINEILDTEIDLTDENAKQTSKTVQEGRIEFQQVSFRYYKDSQEKVLDDVSLTIEPGQTVGIIGSTGCGKTTLVSMIPRLYDADEGRILAVSYTHLGYLSYGGKSGGSQ